MEKAPITCAYAECAKPFAPRHVLVRFCSRSCSNKSRGSSRGPDLPPECSTSGCDRLRLKNDRICGHCMRAREDPERVKARQRRKTHRRKVRTRRAELPLADEMRLRDQAKRCPLCRVRLIDEPYQPASKELDHIVPLNQGGTHTIFNVRIICRSCNIHRPKDGSDFTGQVSLFAVEVA